MNLFHKKSELSSLAFMHLILESTKNEIPSLHTFIDRSLIPCSKDIATINMLSIGFELCRYELYLSNNHDMVDYVLNSVYDEYFYTLDNSVKEQHQNICIEVKNKCEDIFKARKLLAPKEVFAYRLFLEQLHIKESTINPIFIKELLNITQVLVFNAKYINKTYFIKKENINKNDTIDFRF